MQGASIKAWCLIRWDTKSQEKDCGACWVETEVRLKGGVPCSGRQHRHWGRVGSERQKNVGNANVLEENLKQIAIKKKTPPSITFSNLITRSISITKRHFRMHGSSKLHWRPKRNFRYSLPSTRLYTWFKIMSMLKPLPEQSYCITKLNFPVICR